MRNRQELAAFIRALAIPSDRREVLLVEYDDHVLEEMAELESQGMEPRDAEERAVRSLGESDTLAGLLREAEQAFILGHPDALAIGLRVGLGFIAGSFAAAWFLSNHWILVVSGVSWENGPAFEGLVHTLLLSLAVVLTLPGAGVARRVLFARGPRRPRLEKLDPSGGWDADPFIAFSLTLPALALPLLTLEFHRPLSRLLPAFADAEFGVRTVFLWMGWLCALTLAMSVVAIRHRVWKRTHA